MRYGPSYHCQRPLRSGENWRLAWDNHARAGVSPRSILGARCQHAVPASTSEAWAWRPNLPERDNSSPCNWKGNTSANAGRRHRPASAAATTCTGRAIRICSTSPPKPPHAFAVSRLFPRAMSNPWHCWPASTCANVTCKSDRRSWIARPPPWLRTSRRVCWLTSGRTWAKTYRWWTWRRWPGSVRVISRGPSEVRSARRRTASSCGSGWSTRASCSAQAVRK